MGKIRSTIKEFEHLILTGLGVVFFAVAVLLSHAWHADRASEAMMWAGVIALFAEADTRRRVVSIASLGLWTITKGLVSLVGGVQYLPNGALNIGTLPTVAMILGCVAITHFIARRMMIWVVAPDVIERTICVRVRAVPRGAEEEMGTTEGEETSTDPAPPSR